MTAYQAGQNGALYFLRFKQLSCPYQYGTIDYNDWVVGFAEEMGLAEERMPDCLTT